MTHSSATRPEIKTAAHAACAVLEREGIRCWVAPRDIRPGVEYGAAIIEAIERCLVMVLTFSSSANASQQIHREIERAVSKSIPIVPVRIEEVTPTKSMEYFLGGIHWLDALTPPIEQHLTRLADTVNAILQVDVVGRANADSVAARDTIRRDSGSKIEYSTYNEKVDERQADPKHACGGGRPPRLPSPFAAFWSLAALGFIKPARMLRQVRRQRPNPASCLAST